MDTEAFQIGTIYWPHWQPAASSGLKRSYHGRPAGFRTHTLVCLASSVLMLVTMYLSRWVPTVALKPSAPTRPAWHRAS